MTPTRGEPQPVLFPEALGRSVEIGDGQHDVVDPER
jgi:hypothetical protein